MRYTNRKIEQLIKERNDTVEKYNRKIENEIEKEKSKYKFSWKRFSLVIILPIAILTAIYINKVLFDETSIWSWEFYFK